MINKLTLLNFRRFNKIELDINKNFVIITGDNATGKTSLLESIYVTSVTKSLRTNNISELFKTNTTSTLIELLVDNRKYKILYEDNKRIVSIDSKEIKKMGEYIGNIPSVFFTPSELSLITGTPLNRRLFMNIEISQLFSNYIEYLHNYNKTLKERNALLKSMNIDTIYLDLITNKLVDESLNIMKVRNTFIKEINSIINDIHKNFSSNEKIELVYQNSLPFEDSYNFMKSKSSRDIQSQSTNYGIHRDDVLFLINNEDSRIYASQGQKRSIVLSLKIVLTLLIKKFTNKEPILLLDDVLSELDVTRQNNLLKIILDLGQTFITVTNIDLNDLQVLDNYQVINLEREMN